MTSTVRLLSGFSCVALLCLTILLNLLQVQNMLQSVKLTEVCRIELQNVAVSDTTDGDSSNADKYK